MKLNIAYLLLLLVISPNLYGAAESSALAKQDANDGFQGQTVKGLTEIVEQWSHKKIPVEYVETGKGWVDREEFLNKEIDSPVILGSVHNVLKPRIADAEKNATALSTTRPLCAYHFVKSHYFGPSLNTPLAKDAERIDLSTGKSEKIKQFKKARFEHRPGSHLTQAPKQSEDDFRYGYRSQLLAGLIATQEDYKETQDKGALKRSLVVANALAHEIQKSGKTLTIREEQILEKKAVADSLKKEIEAFNPVMSNESVFYMNALIDIHQSEDMYHQSMYPQPNNPDTDVETVDFIFNAANDEFILNSRELVTKTKNSTEVIFEFGDFVKKDGRLPVEECGLQARKIYSKWWFASRGEPAEATALRTVHAELMEKREALKKEELVDQRLYTQNQIEILQDKRDDLFITIRTKVFEATKQLTSKDLAAYCNTVNNRTRLAYAESYLSDEKEAIASEKERIAKETAILQAKPAADDKGKEEA